MKPETTFFDLLDNLLERTNMRKMVFVTDRPEVIKGLYLGKDVEVYIACTRWQLITKRRAFLSLPEQNIKLISLHHLDDNSLKDKLVVCVDYLETKSLIALLFVRLRKLMQIAPISVTQTRRTRFWNISSLKWIARPNKTPLVGSLPDSVDSLISITGKLTDIFRAHYPLLPVLAIITQFNESDIVLPVINHLIEQGVDVHVIDNWSNDGSFESIVELAYQNVGRITVERFPVKDTHRYEWTKLLERVTVVARENIPKYKWVISNDADEMRWSPWRGINIQQALSFVDYCGYNCVDYTVFNFHPVKDGFKQGLDPVTFFEYGEFGSEHWYFIQLKTWRNHPEAEIASSGGHIVNFPGRSIFPFKFFLGHYSIRSNSQAAKKIFKDRVPRFPSEEREKGWHVHYDHVKDGQSFISPKKGLVRYSDVNFLNRYLLQRILGIGIKRR